MCSSRRVAGALLAVTLLAACGTGDDWSQPRPVPTAVGALGAGFSVSTPAPESTITPAAGSWDQVHPPEGYRVVLLTSGTDAPTQTIVEAVTAWAEDEEADLRTIVSAGGQDLVPSVTKAIGMRPELIISAGNDLIDPLTVVSASHLDQQFLTVGAEIPEPTANVTAVNWSGATFRGTDVLASSPYDPTSFTPERCAAAVRAGVAAVLHNLTGIVLKLP